jgi:signal transduction histidine kinase/ligand-binding sensor domain-containing protein/DNA-binding response OmpR family regulator
MRTYLFIFLIALANISSAQPSRIKFTSLTARDGLLSNSVNAFLKDRYGLMWIATDDGLNKYDGTNFTVYRHKTGDSTSLRANEILALYEDKAGNIWVGTSGGALSMYDRRRDKFVHYPSGAGVDGFLPNAVIRGICGDGQGRIWIAQFEAPYVLDPVSGQLSKMDVYNGNKEVARKPLNCIFEDSRHRVWVGTDGGLFLYSSETKLFRHFIHDNADKLSLVNDHVRSLTEDSEGRIWVGTEQGLCALTPDGNGFASIGSMKVTDEVLKGGVITSIRSDRDGILWVGTMAGIHTFDAHSGHTVSYLPEDGNLNSLTSQSIRSIYIDKEGIYWFGTFRGGINKYDKNLNLFPGKFWAAFHESGSKSSTVTSFAQADDGGIWVGTDGGGLFEFNEKKDRIQRLNLEWGAGKSDDLSVLSLKRLRNGTLCIGTSGKGLILLDPAGAKARQLTNLHGPNYQNEGDIYSILEDSKGQIWLGTNGDGVILIKNNKALVRFTPRPASPGDILLPINGYIRAIEEDVKGNIWIGTHGGGLTVYCPGTGAFKVYNQSNSPLPSDKIDALLRDSRGLMWIGTYGGGLSLFDQKTGQFANFSEKDGLQNTTIYQLVEDAQGRLWISTNTGVSAMDVATRQFHNFTHYNGLPNDNFVHGAGFVASDGVLFFGSLQGFNYIDPRELTSNRNVPSVMLTDLRIGTKSVTPGKETAIQQHISIATNISLAYKQNFSLSFVALNYTLPKQNQYAYKLDGFDKDWNYVGALNTASYTNLDPGDYTFHVKACNNDGVWSAADTSIHIYVKPPFWLTRYAYALYLLLAILIVWGIRHRGVRKVKIRYAMEQERARMSQLLEQERREAERLHEFDQLKIKFLTNLSHEFRTPISLITGPLEHLQEKEGNPDKQKQIAMVKRNARRLLNLVNQLLDFRKLEEHELKLNRSDGDIISFLKDASDAFSDIADRKHIHFTVTSDIDYYYTAFDRDKMERILFNLLGNAFKFTQRDGAVSLKIAQDPASKELIIFVADSGVGMSADERIRAFDRFFQGDARSNVLNQGTGIGLSITREFVVLHGGTITVESQPGVGTTFTVSLPLENRSSEISKQAGEEQSAKGAENFSDVRPVALAAQTQLTVLLVEDNDDFREYLRDNLLPFYKIVEATDGNLGWQKALSAHPDVIVSDINMPNMDGIELSRKIKSDKRVSHIPIILLTALTDDAYQLAGLETGASDYLTKPFRFEVLNIKIKNLVLLNQRLRETYTRRLNIETPPLELSSAEDQMLLKVTQFIESKIDSAQLSVEELSNHFCMSRTSFYRKIVDLTGETPVEFVRSVRLNKAAELLEKSDMKIAEIGYAVGFTTPNYFTRAFKAKFDLSPSEYVALKRKAIS